jgi:MscS family membrane protein
VRLVDLFVAYLEPRVALTKSRLDDHILLLLRKSLKIFIIVSVTLITMEVMEIKVTSLIAGLGVGGIAIAFAARDTISNFFGSIAIFADRPFVVGDRVIVEGYEGFIESIGFRTTKIRTLEGTLVTIPNSKMVNTAINNVARRPAVRNMFTIGVTYDTGLEKMRKALEILRDTLKNHKSTKDYWVYFKEYGSHSLDILVVHWCKYLDYEEFLRATEEINLEIMRRFEASKIEFAFPTQTLYLKKEAEGTPPSK